MFTDFEKIEGKSFHLHMDIDPLERHWAVPNWKLTYKEVEEAIENEESEIHAFTMSELYGALLDKGYRIFVYFRNKNGFIDRFEITLGDCDRTTREIKRAHNIWHLLISGGFDLT